MLQLLLPLFLFLLLLLTAVVVADVTIGSITEVMLSVTVTNSIIAATIVLVAVRG